MEQATIEATDPLTLHFLEYNSVISLIGLFTLAITIIYSFKKGGVREVAENIFLWFLLFLGFAKISMHPVDANDEITAGILFVAFGVCRIAKNMSNESK